MYLYLREIKKINGCTWAASVGAEIWGLGPCCGAGAERVKKSNEWSEAVSGVQKINWSVSGAGSRRIGNGAVRGTPVNEAER